MVSLLFSSELVPKELKDYMVVNSEGKLIACGGYYRVPAKLNLEGLLEDRVDELKRILEVNNFRFYNPEVGEKSNRARFRDSDGHKGTVFLRERDTNYSYKSRLTDLISEGVFEKTGEVPRLGGLFSPYPAGFIIPKSVEIFGGFRYDELGSNMAGAQKIQEIAQGLEYKTNLYTPSDRVITAIQGIIGLQEDILRDSIGINGDEALLLALIRNIEGGLPTLMKHLRGKE